MNAAARSSKLARVFLQETGLQGTSTKIAKILRNSGTMSEKC